ncbi:prion-inhibition and propagation-domain-containing protein [Xylariaceae sp. AK1471]|nr:prion-inhibition and propagation-domain-containing protein [Xylariaceae sp. AK1471]
MKAKGDINQDRKPTSRSPTSGAQYRGVPSREIPLLDVIGVSSSREYNSRLNSRLLDWADIAGLSEDDTTLIICQAIKPVLLDILDQQCRLMLRFSRVDQRLPISDNAKLEEILSKLAALGDSLQQLMTGRQMQTLHEHFIRTSYQIVQMNNRFDYLCKLIEADLSMSVSPASTRSDVPSGDDGRLSNLAKFKGLKHTIDEGSFTPDIRLQLGLERSIHQTQVVRLSSTSIQLINEKTYANKQRVPAWLTSSLAPCKRVWVEWTSTKMNQSMSRNDSEPLTIKRFENLVYLLQEDKLTAQFRALHCHGYYVRSCGQSEVQCGPVFENPTVTDSEYNPISLLDILQEGMTPSLSDRLALIRALTDSVEKLHAVNWLHKGLRSQNILFFPGTKGQVELSQPFLSGFKYSRPETADYLSESPPAIAAEDLYHHPAVQGGPRESKHGFGYKKQHDIYSLGILILEIAYWKPLYDILEHRSAQLIRPSETTRIKELLLGGKYVEKVKTYMGYTIAHDSRVSLLGPAAFGVVEDELDIFSAATLQGKFFEVFVKRLQQLRI